jgi:DNA repair protein RecN (Recombination protein N)
MLKRLSIKNYALIEHIEIDFHPQLNIIIGETGAGKSILLGALGLILGKRADTQALFNKNEKCIIEAEFSDINTAVTDLLQENDIDLETHVIIRREILPTSKSRAFINDTPTTLDVLKEITQNLVDIHAQHETQSLTDKYYFIELLDHLAKQKDNVLQFQKQLKELNQLEHKLEESIENKSKNTQQFDYLSFQFNELEEALQGAEDYNAQAHELELMLNSTAIIEWINEAQNIIYEGEINLNDVLIKALKSISQIEEYTHNYGTIIQLLNELYSEIRVAQRKLSSDASQLNFDPERLFFLQEKQTQINKLLQKHQLNNFEDLLSLRDDIQIKLEAFTDSDGKIEYLKQEIAEIRKNLLIDARKISANRNLQIEPFIAQINHLIVSLGMPFGQIKFENNTIKNFNLYGIDEIQLLFSPNKGSEFQSLHDVGSGGEKSRLMLAIKSTIAEEKEMPTLIFDEIDTGISGQIAIIVGDLLKKSAQNRQLIAITHLPQVAAKGHHHFFVYKDHSREYSTTNIKVLNDSEKITTIAHMLSGDNLSESAIEQATLLFK